MLIAHECAHALWTPYKEWEGIDNKELRSYVNVIEDTRIDKLIQKNILVLLETMRMVLIF